MPINQYFRILPNLLSKDDPRYQKWLASLEKRPAPWNKGKTKFTDISVRKISKTFKLKKIDNFSNWRKVAKDKGLIVSNYPNLQKDTNLAFIFGLVLGDGNLHQFPRTECLRITLGTDKPLLIEYTHKILISIFNKNPSLIKRSDSNCADFRLYQKHLSKRLGIPTGSRAKLVLNLPKWIWKNKKFLTACLRGLFEAEGSFSIHLPTYTYNLSFSNNNITLLNEVEKALIYLGFHPERRYNAVRLRRKAEAYKFIELISFRKYN